MINRRAFLRTSTITAAGLAMGRHLSADDKGGFIQIDSLVDLARYSAMDNVQVQMKAGQYPLNEHSLKQMQQAAPQSYKQLPNEDFYRWFLRFSGSGSTYKLNDVSILIDSNLHKFFGFKTIDEIFITGKDNIIEGLDIKDVGDTHPTRGARMLHVTGDDNTLLNVSLFVQGSSPYGYGNHLGKGANSLVPLHKHTSMLITGKNDKVIGCRIITRAYGHALAMQGSVNALIEDCYIEGEMRNTNDMLRETSGQAFNLGFKSDYPPGYIPPARVICLSEDGVRAYPSGGSHVQGRRTQDITVRNTTVKNMRSGFDLSVAGGKVLVSGCTAIGCDEKGFNVPSGGVIEKSKGDAMYGPVLSMWDDTSKDCRIELEVMDASGDYPPQRLAEINGTGHRITLRNHLNKRRAISIPIVLGRSFYTDVNHWRGVIKQYNDRSGGSGITLINRTTMPILICDNISDCNIATNGVVIDDQGKNNRITKIES